MGDCSPMRLFAVLPVLTGVFLASTALAAPPALDADAINGATLVDWQARKKAAAETQAQEAAQPAGSSAEATASAPDAVEPEADSPPPPVPPEPVPAEAAPEAFPANPSVGTAPGETPAQLTEVPQVPDESTDLPDEAALQNPSAEPAGDTGASGEGQPAGAGDVQAEKPADQPDPFLIRLQVLLDRQNASPGSIDGLMGNNTQKAIRAFQAMHDLPADGKVGEETWDVLSVDAEPAVTTYTITQKDVDGRYVEHLPSDYAELAKLDWLGYRGPSEMLAERFHMDEQLLERLNAGADFKKAGTQILVAAPGGAPAVKIKRIEVDKSAGELSGYTADGHLALVYPATIGSPENPSPSGTVTVEAIAPDPDYAYDPGKNFKQGKNDKPLRLPPGPNGPVGAMWIDLSKPTYGIHGTPEPDLIDKSGSHGCVRLTNWDAQILAGLVEPKKTVVEFKE